MSHQAVTILCPHGETLSACLGEYTVGLCNRTVAMCDTVAISCLGTLLEGTASLGVGLGEVEQQGGTVSADHLGAIDQDLSDTLGVTHEGGEAGGGDDLDHGSQVAGGGGGLSPSLESILQHREPLSRVERPNRDSAPTGTRSRVGGGAVLDWR